MALQGDSVRAGAAVGGKVEQPGVGGRKRARDVPLTAWPDQSPRPLASDLNWTVGQTVPSLAVVELSSAGKIDLYNAAGTTDVVIDVAGWYQ